MKHQIIITIDTDKESAALDVRDELACAIEDFIESHRPGFSISVGNPTQLGGSNDLAAIEAAREAHEDEGTLEIDENPIVSFSSDGGAYVGAWVWVSDSQIEAQGGTNPETTGPEEEEET